MKRKVEPDALDLYEAWQTRQALQQDLKARYEYSEADIEIGRARERQLIAEAEREAARKRGNNEDHEA